MKLVGLRGPMREHAVYFAPQKRQVRIAQRWQQIARAANEFEVELRTHQFLAAAGGDSERAAERIRQLRENAA